MDAISVIIPAYNAQSFLREAIESVRAQSLAAAQIIVVDDGSSDDSAAIASAEGVPVQLLRREHAGIAATRNAGIAAATGALIAFLDADDLWPQNSLEDRAELLRADPDASYAFGQIACFDDATENWVGEPEAGRLPGSLLVRREVFDAVGNFDTSLRVGEAIDWIARVDAAGFKSIATDKTVLNRRVHAANTTRDKEVLHEDYLAILRRRVEAGRVRSKSS